MFRAVNVKALPDYRIFVEFDDGVQGEVDLSALSGKGVFQAWDESSRISCRFHWQ